MELIKPGTQEFYKFKKEYDNLIQNITRVENYSKFIGGLPITLEKKDILNIVSKDINNNYSYTITQKVDGNRFLLFSGPKDETGYRKICFIDRNNNFYKAINYERNELPGFNGPKLLIDGELVLFNNKGEVVTDINTSYKNIQSYSFMAFDILCGPINIVMEGEPYNKRLILGSEAIMAGPIGGKMWSYKKRYDLLYSLIVPTEFNDNRPPLSLTFKNIDWFIPEVKCLYIFEHIKDKNQSYIFEYLPFNIRNISEYTPQKLLRKTTQSLYSNQSGYFQESLVTYRKQLYTKLKNIYKKSIILNNVKLDGLIFTPFYTEYIIGGTWNEFLNTQFKWKPPEEQSIDFYIDNSKGKITLKIFQPSQGLIDFRIGRNIASVTNNSLIKLSNVKTGTIGEFIFDRELNKFELLLLRPDKHKSNSLKTALNVMNAIKYPVKIDIIKAFLKLDLLDDKKINELMKYCEKDKLLRCIINNSNIPLLSQENKLMIIEKIEKCKSKESYEFEIRLGYIGKFKYETNIPYLMYNQIKNVLFNSKIPYSYSIFNDYYHFDKNVRTRYLYSDKYKSFVFLDTIAKQKDTVTDIDTKQIYNTDLRFVLSDEIKRERLEGSEYSHKILEKKRTSFKLGLIDVDCTEIRKMIIDKDTKIVSFDDTVYQVEFEVINSYCNSMTSEDIYNKIINYLTKILGSMNI